MNGVVLTGTRNGTQVHDGTALHCTACVSPYNIIHSSPPNVNLSKHNTALAMYDCMSYLDCGCEGMIGICERRERMQLETFLPPPSSVPVILRAILTA